MENHKPYHLPNESADGTQLLMEKLSKVAPSCFTEVRDEQTGELRRVVNFKTLRQLLGDDAVEDEKEYYEFTWPGKFDARREAAKPISKTLRPVVEDSSDWDNTENVYIEGDNLEALKLLQKSYLGKIKMIYIDPPYNTGNDFVYHDDFAQTQDEYDLFAGDKDEEGNRFRKNTDTNGRFHSDWCSMIYPRLQVARTLLSEDGYICVSIDDNECTNLIEMMNEIMGESNFYASFIIVRSEGGGLAKRAVIGHDYMVVYAKNILNALPLGRPKDIRGKIVEKDGEKYWIETDWFREVFGKYGTCHYEDILKFYNEGKKNEIDEGIKEGKYVLIPRDNKHIIGRYRKVADDTSKFYTILKSLNKNGVLDLKKLELDKYFDYPKPVSLIKDFIQGVTIHSIKDCNVILDFFSGSATTAHAVMQLNAEDGGKRKYIMVQLSELTDEKSEAYKAGYKNICEIGKERIRRAGKKIKEENPDWNGDTGFRVFRVDDSNKVEVARSPKDLSQGDLDLFLDNIKPDRNDLDLLFGCMIDWGMEFALSQPMATEEVDGCKIYSVNGNDLVACFADNITDKVIERMAEMEPVRVLFRDSCFGRDDEKINVFERFKQALEWNDDQAINNIRVI